MAKAAAKKPWKISEAAVERAGGRERREQRDIFRPAEFPKGVAPASKDQQMAMDEAGGWAQTQFSLLVDQGLGFMGFAILAEMSQRTEYRACVDTLASEMTRMWIKIKAKSVDEEDEDKTDKIAQIEEEFERLKVREKFRKAAETDGFFGRGQIYLDLDPTGNGLDKEETSKPIGDGSEQGSGAKVTKGRGIARLVNVEPMWSYPIGYNSTDPLARDWYKPTTWLVMGKPVHASRILTFISKELPDILKPAYGFCGLSLTQMLKPYVDNWVRTRQSVADLIRAFTIFVIKTDMSAMLQGDSTGNTFEHRMEILKRNRDNRGILAVDKENEDFDNISAPLSTLDILQAQALEHISTASRIPTVKWTGEQPAGLNADSEGVLSAWYDYVLACQESFFKPNLEKLLNFVQLGLFGSVDPNITFEFVPLKQMDPKEKAEIRKMDAETDAILINDCNSISAEESRKRIAADPETPFAGLNVDELPEPPVDEHDIDIKGFGDPRKEAA